MEASLSASHSVMPSPISIPRLPKHPNPTAKFICNRTCKALTGKKNQRLMKTRVAVASIDDVSAVSDPARVDITWQIVVGAIAGVTPFIVAGIEFSKRIIAQRRCEECGGSGLVFRGKDYFKCPECGGFLPWQSWKRFFTG